MNYPVDYLSQSHAYDLLKSPTDHYSSGDQMEPLLQNIEEEEGLEDPMRIEIEGQNQDQGSVQNLQGEKTDEDLVRYKSELESFEEGFSAPDTKETKSTSEGIKESSFPISVEEAQMSYLSKLEDHYQQIEAEHRKLLLQIKQEKGIEFLEQEIRIFFDFVKERHGWFHNPPTNPEAPQDSPIDLQAAGGEPSSPRKNNEDASLNKELSSQLRSFETAHSSEENHGEKNDISSPSSFHIPKNSC